jgi:sec-independent protein translocase protein TatC
MTPTTNQTFSGHTQELRKRLLITVACFFISLTIALLGHSTVTRYWIQYTASHIPTNSQTSPLVILSPTDAIYTVSSLSFTISLMFTLPLFIWQLYCFIKPGLSQLEHRIVCKSLYIGSAVFLSSVCITLFTIYPSLIRWLYDFNSQYGQNVWSMRTYIHFFTITVLTTSVGLSAIAMAVYILIGYPEAAKWCQQYRRYIICAIFVFAAVITPPDVFSQLVVAIPCLILFEIILKIKQRV